MKKIFIILIFSLLLIDLVSAKSSPEFLDYLTDTIYEDCERYDLRLNLAANGPKIVLTQTNEPLDIIPWPYTKGKLREVIEILDSFEYAIIRDGWVYGDVIGYSMLLCGRNLTKEKNAFSGWLDNDGIGYLWNQERVIMPKEEIKTTHGDNSPIIETGDNSPVTTGDNSPIIEAKKNSPVIIGDNSQVVETKGDNSPITSGDNSPINQKIKKGFVNFYINNYIILNITFSLSILLNIYFIINLFKRKKFKKVIKQPIQDKPNPLNGSK